MHIHKGHINNMDIEEQYDKIYRYCYFKLNNKELAEDVTQETFLRYMQHYSYDDEVTAVKYLYTIARNICVDQYRNVKTEEIIPENAAGTSMEEQFIRNMAVKDALSRLTHSQQEILLLRYVNEVPVSIIGKIYGISRFSVYRRITAAVSRFKEELRKEDYNEQLEK